MADPRALVLFDIDGTLIRRSGPHHRQVLVDAVRAITGVETTTDGVPVAGMLDREILRIMMTRAGMAPEETGRVMPRVVRRAQWLYARCCPDLQRKVCPGVRGLLQRLRERKVTTGLVTGNLSRIAWKKMEHSGLRRYFRFGAFAELADDRSGLVRIAIAEARRRRWIEEASPVSLIGDHPNDVKAARASGARSIAVATGVVSFEELLTHTPDRAVRDLRELDVEALL